MTSNSGGATTMKLPEQTDKPGPERAKRSWTGWLIMAIILLPMVAAYVIFTTGVGIPSGTVNKGDLLLPATAVSGLQITDELGSRLSIPGDHKIWRMVVVGGNDCDQACRELLYVSRQVHVRLGDKAGRVERLYLNTDRSYAADFKQTLVTDYPHLVRAYVDAGAWNELFAQTSIAARPPTGQNIYLIDQQGFAMMSYDTTHKGGELLGDIKRLLKYSYEE